MTRRFHDWVRPGDCTDGPQPGAKALLAAALDVFGDDANSLGIYNCRTVRGSDSPSVHGEGRAIDIGLPMEGVTAAGHQILDRILANAWELGACYAVYDRVDFNQAHPWGDTYRGTHPHHDHLHLELTWHAARNLNYTTAKALLEDRPMEQLSQVVVVPAQAANEWDRPLGAAIATWAKRALVSSDASGVLRTVLSDPYPPGTQVEVTDFAIVIGGKTKYRPSNKAIRIAGADRWETAEMVARFIDEHDPATWSPTGRPF